VDLSAPAITHGGDPIESTGAFKISTIELSDALEGIVAITESAATGAEFRSPSATELEGIGEPESGKVLKVLRITKL
jgi:hypothetical protein